MVITGGGKMTQIEQVLEYMKNHDGITSLDAFRMFGCTRLSDKIFRLRKRGYKIDSIREKGKNGYYARYVLVDGGVNE